MIAEAKKEIDGILSNYGVPMDDRSLVAEKVDGVVKEALLGQMTFVQNEITKVKAGIAQTAAAKEREELKAYEEGFSDGFEDGQEEKGVSLPFVLVGLFLAGLTFVVVSRNMFGKGERK